MIKSIVFVVALAIVFVAAVEDQCHLYNTKSCCKFNCALYNCSGEDDPQCYSTNSTLIPEGINCTLNKDCMTSDPSTVSPENGTNSNGTASNTTSVSPATVPSSTTTKSTPVPSPTPTPLSDSNTTVSSPDNVTSAMTPSSTPTQAAPTGGSTTVKPSTTTPPESKHSSLVSRFDVGSFIGGIVLCGLIVLVIFIVWKVRSKKKLDNPYSQF